MEEIEKIKRDKLWKTGKVVKRSEGIKCGCNGSYACKNDCVREFEFGFFCYHCFLSAKICSTKGCNNPIQYDRKLKNTTCRLCQFDYKPDPQFFCESAIADMEIWADEGSFNMDEELNAAIEKYDLKRNMMCRQERKSNA